MLTLRRRVALGAIALALALLVACGSSESAHSGSGQPIVVRNGQFFEGAFPADQHGPAVLTANSRFNLVPAGTAAKKFSGTAEVGAVSVALAFKDLGSGFWIVPVGPQDPDLGVPTFSASSDFARDIPAGNHPLRFAAASADGRFGPPFERVVQTLARTPTGHIVASLTWGNDSDLDLHIVGPSGKELDPKHPSTGMVADAGANAGELAPGAGVLNRDSNAGCVIDGYRQEDVIWGADGDTATDVEAGTYLVRVDMWSACRQAATSFTFTLYVDGTEILQRSGRLLDIDADGGGPGSGLFIGQFNCDGSGTCS
jgi:hypothetical protein